MAESLYAITAEMARIIDLIEASDEGEISPELVEHIDQIEGDLKYKADNVLRYMAALDARAAGIDGEIKRLKAMKDAAEKRYEGLKEYLKASLERAGLKKLETPLHVLTVVKSGKPSIRVAEGQAIPDDYKRTKTEVALDGTKAFEDWKAGVELPPTLVVAFSSSLRIK